MNICPITYEPISKDSKYSKRGLKLLSPSLAYLKPLPLTAAQQRQEAVARAAKMSLQGVQPKLSAYIDPKAGCFSITDRNGKFILKPPSDIFPQLPQNEDLTMRLATDVGLDVPLHGMVYSADGSLTYFIKRFDRYGRNYKLAVEDFAQLKGVSRDTKYEATMEDLVPLLDFYCTIPAVEKLKLFRLTLFSFLIGNEDMHLKNFSVITREGRVELSPCYDLLNTTIAMKRAEEEMALSINNKKHDLNREDLVEYFGGMVLALNEKVIDDTLHQFSHALPGWRIKIQGSFLLEEMKQKYLTLLQQRSNILALLNQSNETAEEAHRGR